MGQQAVAQDKFCTLHYRRLAGTVADQLVPAAPSGLDDDELVQQKRSRKSSEERRAPGFWNSALNRKLFLKQLGERLGVKEVRIF